MEVRLVTDEKAWETFLLKQTPNTFLQSWKWGEFNEALGKRIFRLGLFDKNELVGICLLISYQTKIANYLYCPRGPVLTSFNSDFQKLLTKVKEIAREEKVDFVKFEPGLTNSEDNEKIFSDLGFKQAQTFIQAEDVQILDLTASEEELLANMRKTTRYLIKNEPKQAVTVTQGKTQKDIEEFVELLFETSNRKGFVNQNKDYYLKQFRFFSGEDQISVFKAIKNGQVQAASVILFYGDSAYYLHGASSPGTSSVGYSLQWAAIMEAKRRGLKYYNFWGIAKEKYFYPKHPWYGFSLFKKGFGGRELGYIRGQDLPLTNKYGLYRTAEKVRLIKRRIFEGYSVE